MVKNIIDKPLKLVSFALVIAACLALSGCAGASTQGSSSDSASSASTSASASASAASSEASSSASSESSAGLVFGTQTGTALSIAVTNGTGADITQLTALPASGEGTPAELMGAQGVLPAGERATVYVEPMENGVFTWTFLVGGEQRQLHNLNLAIIHEANILVQDDVAYITATIDGNPVSSLQEEYDIAHPAVVEEEPEYYYEEYVDYGGEPEQGEDSCVSDVILN